MPRSTLHPMVRTVIAMSGVAAILAAAPSASAPDPCSYLTTAQVSAALGIPVADGKLVVPKLCFWQGTGQMDGKKVALTILTMDGFNTGKTPLSGTEKPAVSGVGEDAYYKYWAEPRYDKIKVVDLDVKKGSIVFGIEVTGFPLNQGKAIAKTLATQVAAKI